QVRRILSDYDSSRYTILENDENLGYLRTVNRGIRAGSSPYVVLLNSDTVVTPSWLGGLLRCFATDPKIAVVNPVSNWANWTRIDPPDGFTTDEIAALVRRVAKDDIRDIYNASGFCFAVRRSVFDDLGLFDEVYGTGYWEETDFCMKAISRGFRVVVDLGTFIYHYGWGSHGSVTRNVMMERNKSIFLSRWQELYEQVRAKWLQQRPEKILEEAVIKAAGIRSGHSPETPAPRSKFAETIREYGVGVTAKGGMAWVCNKILGTDLETRPYSILARQFGAFEEDPAKAATEVGTSGWLKMRYGNEKHLVEMAAAGRKRLQENPPRSTDGLRVIYIVPDLKLYGGIVSVVQIVNNLVERGIKANVATYGEGDEAFMRGMPLYFAPHRFPDRRAMLENFPDCDLIVATWWETVFDALVIQKARPQVRLAYFVQDYEPEFYPPDSERA
ncbi:MAG: glycosyltransferase, partial [Armatimonadetes bacterium]|nr:glycosyltransferase [Armatimonadota bacterium]NIN05772.1 glycosyltransferase [Armatimonadota bacterium]NIO76457.1 glycosyltransferase [Armatimonadota bacterium]